MSKTEIHSKIRKNIKELKSIIDLLENNQSKEKGRYLIHLARIYIYETIQLLSDDRVTKSIKEIAINEISVCSASLSPLSVLAQRNRIGIN